MDIMAKYIPEDKKEFQPWLNEKETRGVFYLKETQDLSLPLKLLSEGYKVELKHCGFAIEGAQILQVEYSKKTVCSRTNKGI